MELTKREAKVLGLLSLHGESYGLDLVKRSNEVLKRGTIYVTLNNLEERDLIYSHLESNEARTTPTFRRIYKITPLGEKVLREQQTLPVAKSRRT